MNNSKARGRSRTPAQRAPGEALAPVRAASLSLNESPEETIMSASSPPADRFGNPVDPIVRYARGTILKSTDEEVQRMLRARRWSATACAGWARTASTTSRA